MRLEERPHRGEKGEDAGLRRDDVPGRSDDSRNERGERDGPQRDRGAGVGAEGIEQDGRRRVHDECVAGRDRQKDEAACLEPSVAETGRKDGEEDGLRRPGEGQRVVRDELCGRHGDQGEGRRANDERERAVATLEREPRAGPHPAGGEEHEPAIGPLREELRSREQCRSRPGQRQGRCQRAQVGLATAEAEENAGDQENGREREPDGNGGVIPRPVPIGDESDRLRADDRGDGRQQRLPLALRGDHRGRREHDHREGRRGGGHARVDRLERRRERGADEPDARQDLRAPRERDHGRQRGDRARERKRECVGHEVVARRGRRERRVGPCRTGSHGREGREELAVPGADEEARAEDECRGDRPEEDALGGPDPPAVRGEHEQQAYAQRRHCSPDDREAARAEELPALDQLARGQAGRTRFLPGRHHDGRVARRRVRLDPRPGRLRRCRLPLCLPGRLHGRQRMRLHGLGARNRADLTELLAERVDPALDRVQPSR
jgi:hypothetical protein